MGGREDKMAFVLLFAESTHFHCHSLRASAREACTTRRSCREISIFGVQGQRPAGGSKGASPLGAARVGQPDGFFCPPPWFIAVVRL